ncbi:DUF4198 domain-containing protein [Azonexus fungiphilus]|uniref:DUF4198 domain-containing protein n=1 Tax=Azonexus fungiphilus TaxID=146940 RepID=UPI00156B9C8F|nr:DUF4198 domain-containing protein [Azonexus fungiphilus]NHC05958.1 DUF4198 domain-containing protein [Azonexus fungiphilus]
MQKGLKFVAAVVASLGLQQAQAHDIWLEPSSTVLSKAGYITVAAAAGNDKFVYNHAPLRGLEHLAAIAPDGSKVAPENFMQGKLRSVLDLNLAQTGTYRLTMASGGVMASWKEGGESKRFRGNAEAFAKNVPAGAEDLKVSESLGRLETFVTVGKPTPLTATGVGLEMVPLTHPNDLVAGEVAVFRFDLEGKPAKDLEVVLVRGGTRYRDQKEEIKLKTDAEGKISVKWPQPGLYWLDVDAQDAKTTVKQAKERRLSYVATLEVLPQ